MACHNNTVCAFNYELLTVGGKVVTVKASSLHLWECAWHGADVSVVNVSPCNLVCVDKRAPVLLYPLAIPDLRQLVSKLMWRSNFFPIQFHYELVEKIKFFKLRFVNSKGKTVGPSRINELYSSMAFPVVPLYWLTCKNLLWIFLKGLKPPSSGSTPCVN